MKSKSAVCAMGALAIGLALGSFAQAETDVSHKLLQPQDIQWGPGPAALPGGAEAAVLFGDPNKDGLFALRVRIPKDYYIAPHTHAKAEVVTILSGRFSLGMGSKANRASTQHVGAGGFVSIQPEIPHYVFADEETVLQITSTGPWGINYVDPKDDPRLNIAPRHKEGLGLQD
ncbi:cupin domain-containing protein [Methylocystis echinoides]|jgi:quercetin dioxygenase-like cupin family protein|uniref:Cupin n=1 Tax=Methylocystis echinoides TaxID=29468 RepID=A0A9W6LSB0_9HYPH|nr:cupin domain-containing protein [Methylocystis echinoides]GLI93485.1 cupin [Methylocystis echinoides]